MDGSYLSRESKRLGARPRVLISFLRSRWITPSLFSREDIVDEYTLCEKDANAEAILQKHWNSFIKEDDFRKIREVGFNMVRIGIGCE